MKNILYTFLAFGLFFSCNNKQNDFIDNIENDIVYHIENYLRGNVKSIYTTSFVAIEKFGEIEKGDKEWQYSYEYDNKSIYYEWEKIEHNYYDKDGELFRKYKYKVDEGGGFDVPFDLNVLNKKGETLGTRADEHNIYDKDGEILGNYADYKLDYSGNKIEKNYYDKDGELFRKYKYKYVDGNHIDNGLGTFNVYDKDGGLFQKYIYKFFLGNLIEKNCYDKDGELFRKYKYKVDYNSRLIEKNVYDKDGDLEYKSNYKFDDKENWIQQIKFIDDKPAFIIEREIKYYN